MIFLLKWILLSFRENLEISWNLALEKRNLEVSLFNLVHFVLKKYVRRIRISPLLPLIMKFNKQQEPIQCLSNTRWPTATHWVTKSQLGGEGKFKRFHLIRKGIWSQFFCDFSKKLRPLKEVAVKLSLA